MALLEAAVEAAIADPEPVFEYVAQEDPRVAGRALYVLVHVPQTLRRGVLEALKHPDSGVRVSALAYSAPCRDDSAIQDAVVDIIVNDPSSSVRYHAIQDFRGTFRKAANSEIRERVVLQLATRLRQYDARSLRLIVELLGEIAEPGDSALMQRLSSLYEDADSLPTKKRGSLMIRLQFALANLGDERAFAQFAEAIDSAPIDERLAHLELLERFRPTPQTLEWVIRLLDDDTEIQNVAPSHLPAKIFRKTRDFAVSALGYWFEDFPVETRARRTYESEEVALARQWLDERLKSGEAP